jgi:hypothetical protein
MKAAFPTAFDAVFLGKSRNAGEFQAADDQKVSYGDAYELAFESSEGLTQTVQVTVKALDEVAQFDVAKLPKLTTLRVEGDVFVNDGRTSFRPSKVVKVGS